MPKPTRNPYAQWLSATREPNSLHDDTPPPERLLQQVWRHQRLRRDRLRTPDGRVVHVLHPGFWNREPGPDFRGAVIQFDDEPALTGDVEIDLGLEGWKAHGHARNPAFSKVILHVVWEAKGAAGERRVLALGSVLDAPVEELEEWLAGDATHRLPAHTEGLCAGPLRGVTLASAREILEQAALSRLVRKAQEIGARARHHGWERALWEALLGALGYKHNVWPMRRVAELVTGDHPVVAFAPGVRGSTLEWQARLMGIASFLPSHLPRNSVYVRSLWDSWWRDRGAYAEWVLPRPAWKLAGTRPANHPQRRLALAGAWLASGDLIRRLESWALRSLDSPRAPVELLALMQPTEVDEHWRQHWTLTSPRRSGVGPLLGAPRATDLAVNAVLPWLWARARSGRDERLRLSVEAAYRTWPASEDNAVLRLARDRLFGGVAPRLPRTAALQQGVLQVVRDFCSHSNSLCAGCRFPELVRAIGG